MAKMYARLLHDVQRADLNFKPRSKQVGWGGLSNPPETVVFNEKPYLKIGKGTKIKITPAFDRLLRDINSKDAYKKIMIPAAGWINYGEGAETISFGGNLIEIDDVEGVWYRAKALAFDAPIPQVVPPMDYITRPELIHKFNAVKKNGGFIKLANGIDAYIPFMKRTEMWIHKSQIELFPALPFFATVNPLMLLGINIRLHPNKTAFVVDTLPRNTEVNIVDYACSAGDVWGYIEDTDYRGWICLQQQTGWLVTFFTNWKMATQPPI